MCIFNKKDINLPIMLFQQSKDTEMKFIILLAIKEVGDKLNT